MGTTEHPDDDQPLPGNWIHYFDRINRLPDARYRRLLNRILDTERPAEMSIKPLEELIAAAYEHYTQDRQHSREFGQFAVQYIEDYRSVEAAFSSGSSKL